MRYSKQRGGKTNVSKGEKKGRGRLGLSLGVRATGPRKNPKEKNDLEESASEVPNG